MKVDVEDSAGVVVAGGAVGDADEEDNKVAA